MFASLFDEVDDSNVQSEEHGDEFTEDEINKLDELEESIHDAS
jgi:hypothetical protein